MSQEDERSADILTEICLNKQNKGLKAASGVWPISLTSASAKKLLRKELLAADSVFHKHCPLRSESRLLL
jgi:hypothetical protein